MTMIYGSVTSGPKEAKSTKLAYFYNNIPLAI